MKTNVPKSETTPGFTTHEGAPAVKESSKKELVRAVSCCMLFEDTFYEAGSDIAERIAALCKDVDIPFLCDLTIKAREDLKLRHVPLFLCVQLLAKKAEAPWVRKTVGRTIGRVIQRADELGEILALYWKDGRKPVPRQLKVGLAIAFRKFDEYQLAKYDREGSVKLRDALFLSHAKPRDAAQGALWRKLVDRKLAIPDTWEVQLSAGKDKKETFERLIRDNKLGYLALLRNLRNMESVGVDREIIEKALLAGAEKSKALPFRFIAAARHAPSFAATISDAMLIAIKGAEPLSGRTAIIVDGSGSMQSNLSEKSQMTRSDAATALAILLRETSSARVFGFSDSCVEVPAHRGLGLGDAIRLSVPSQWTLAGKAVRHVLDVYKDVTRIIMITDEQSADPVPALMDGVKGYLINVATYAPALPEKGGSWTHISGFSERIIDWIREEEREEAPAPIPG